MSAARATAAERFFADVIDRHGIQEGNRVRIPMRQCELARQRNIAASTVGAYLNALGPRVVARSPHIVISNERATATAPREDIAFGLDDLTQLLVEVLEVQQRLLRALVAHGVRGSANISRGSAENASDPREVLADLPKEERKDDQELPSFLPSPRSARSARGSANRDSLLQPLHRLCDELHLTPLNNPAPLDDALAPYSDDEVRAAVAGLAREVRHGPARISSPFGLLIARARAGSIAVGVAQASLCAPDQQAQLEPAPDDGLLETVTAYESQPAQAHRLARLDRDIVAANPSLRIDRLRPPMLRALRADALREMLSGPSNEEQTGGERSARLRHLVDAGCRMR